MLLVGLGNPGKKYENTRHNCGFMFVDEIAKAYNVSFKIEKKLECIIGSFEAFGEKHYIIKPTTYMNLSGKAVSLVMNYYNIDIKDVVVAYDDMDLYIGKVRIRERGSSGGHNGMKSIIASVGTQDFTRIRIGISKANLDVIDYVLSKFNSVERKDLDKILQLAPEVFSTIAQKGVVEAMNKYNGA